MQFENTQELQTAIQNGQIPADRVCIGYQGTVVEMAVEVWHAGECIFRLSRPTDAVEARRPKGAAARLARQVRQEIGATRPVILDTDIHVRKGYHHNGRPRREQISSLPRAI